MNEEPITLTMTEEQFVECVAELIDVEIIDEMTTKQPVILLEMTIICMELWKILEKHARMQIVADTIKNMKKED